MTAPTITYGHIAMHDLDSVTSFSETDTNNIAGWASDGDVITATVTPTADAQTAQYEYDHTTTASTTTLSKILCRFKTSVSSAGVKAGLKVTFTDASTQTIDLGFSTTWKTTATTLTLSKTIDKVALVVTASGWTAGTFYVYFDFYLACKGVFTFPYVHGNVDVEMPINDANLRASQRVGNITQLLGADSVPIMVTGEMDAETDWKGTNNIIGEIFYDIAQNAYTEAFQWFTSDVVSCKVRPVNIHLSQMGGTNAQRVYTVSLREYRKRCGSNENYYERFGLI